MTYHAKPRDAMQVGAQHRPIKRNCGLLSTFEHPVVDRLGSVRWVVFFSENHIVRGKDKIIDFQALRVQCALTESLGSVVHVHLVLRGQVDR